MKTFKDLEFKKKGNDLIDMGSHASLSFDNDYGISVITGRGSYTSEHSPYEIAVLYKGELCYSTGITDSVLIHQNETQVNEVMNTIQKLK